MTVQTTAQVIQEIVERLDRMERKFDLVMLSAGLATPDYAPPGRDDPWLQHQVKEVVR